MNNTFSELHVISAEIVEKIIHDVDSIPYQKFLIIDNSRIYFAKLNDIWIMSHNGEDFTVNDSVIFMKRKSREYNISYTIKVLHHPKTKQKIILLEFSSESDELKALECWPFVTNVNGCYDLKDY